MKYDTNVIVPVPEKCKLSKSRVGGKLKAIYVQKVLSTEYHPDKKYNTDSQRISIGKLISLNEEQRLMHPNEFYYSYYSINEDEDRKSTSLKARMASGMPLFRVL